MSNNEKHKNKNNSSLTKEKTNEDFNKKNETGVNSSQQKTPNERTPNIGDSKENGQHNQADKTKQNINDHDEKTYQPNKELPKIGDQTREDSIDNSTDKNKGQKEQKQEEIDQRKN